MKTKYILAILTVFSFSLFASIGQNIIVAIASGNWSDTNIWSSGTVPGTDDAIDVESPMNVVVDTNEVIHFIAGGGQITMGAGSTLILLDDAGIAQGINLVTTAIGNTVMYVANPFGAKQCNYYNLVLDNTNYVPAPPFVLWEDFNNFSSTLGPTPMTIAGDMTILGAVKVQQGSGGAPITILGNLTIGSGCAWDCSGDILTVSSNIFVYGLLEDLNSSLGTNYCGGNVIVAGPSVSVPSFSGGTYSNGWYISDVTTWGVGGSITNNGSTFGKGYGSISFNGAGVISGTNVLTIPTITVNGTYSIYDTIILTTNTPTLNGTVIFDIARTNQIVLKYAPSLTSTNTTATNYYSGNLVVVNSGAAPTAGSSYKFFTASNYAGSFASTTFPNLPAGLSWVDNLATSGSIAVSGAIVGAPALSISSSGGVITLSWNSTAFPGYRVQGQTNSAGLKSNWGPTGSSTTSPYTININPTNPPVFFRLSNP